MTPKASKKVINHKMDDSTENFHELEKCSKWIGECNLNKVCLQFPDDLLPNSVEIALHLESCINKKVYILGDTTCGSCCVDEIAAEHINGDSIIHFGHTCLSPSIRLPVFHVLPKKEINIIELTNKFKSNFENESEKILFFYDVAYAHKIESIHQILSPIYKNLIFTSLNCTSNVEFVQTKNSLPISILGRSFKLEEGCKIEDYTAFFLGSDGKTFAALAMTIPTNKWYYYEDNIIEYEALNTPWLKRRRYLTEKLKDAKVVGIVVATLGIKDYLKIITMMKNILKKKNKKSYILSIGKINPAKLANFPEIDAFVVITCPENEVFDSREFLKPILMPYEVELAFNSSREYYAQYCMDFRQILPTGMNYVDFKASADSDISLITGELRNCDSESKPCTDKMNALAINNSAGIVAIGKAGAEYLYNRSWKGVEQRLGKDAVHSAEVGRCGLPSSYENEPISVEKDKE